MLVLSRKDNEAITIGNDIRIVLIEAKDGRAKIGIDAPTGIAILREELSFKKKS